MENEIRVDKAGLVAQAQKMLEQDARLGAISVVDLDDRWELVYHFEVPLDVVNVRFQVAKGEHVPSITGVYLAALTSENEVRDLTGLEFDDLAIDYHWRFLHAGDSPHEEVTLPAETRVPVRLDAPCKKACPAGLDVPRYVRLIGEGHYSEALAVIKQDLPFPGIIGRVCLAYCEEACRQAWQGDAICIRLLKRFAYEKGSYEEKVTASATGKRVAVVGGGPAGLAGAYFLAKLGHSVDVFDALDQIGGLMRLGISETRLPRNIMEEELSLVEKLGVGIKTKTRVESLDRLFKEGYDAILVAVGSTPAIRRGDIIGPMSGHEQMAKQFGLATERIETGVGVRVDPETQATSREGVFAAGDAVTGARAVISSIGAAKKAAIGIDKYLGGEGKLPQAEITIKEPTWRHTFLEREAEKREVEVKLVDGSIRAVVEHGRPNIPYVTMEEAKGRGEDEIGLTDETAVAEGQRCWRCDLEE